MSAALLCPSGRDGFLGDCLAPGWREFLGAGRAAHRCHFFLCHPKLWYAIGLRSGKYPLTRASKYQILGSMKSAETLDTKCGFAMSGTYGHECGAPATQVAVKRSELTHSGTYFARRCDSCAKICGGENANTLRFEPFEPARHVNDWNGRYN